jgi:hypothetical protein
MVKRRNGIISILFLNTHSYLACLPSIIMPHAAYRIPCKNACHDHYEQSNAQRLTLCPSIQTYTSQPFIQPPSIPFITHTKPLSPKFSVHLLHLILRTHLRLLNSNPHQTPFQHPLPINPRMHLPKQLTPIPARRPQQLRLAPRMIRRIRTDIVHLASQHRPSIFPLPTRHLLQQRRRDSQVRRRRRQAAQVRGRRGGETRPV